MFHVSTMLPYSKKDHQQIERKRHLGNDAVLIVFHDGTTPFSPQCITSKYNRNNSTHTLSFVCLCLTNFSTVHWLQRFTWWCRHLEAKRSRSIGLVSHPGRTCPYTRPICQILPSSQMDQHLENSFLQRVLSTAPHTPIS